jgi:hypothetical protein
MKPRLQALRALRWNYTRKGVWVWLKGRSDCQRCNGSGLRPTARMATISYGYVSCPCEGKRKRGYQRVLSEPERVIAEQDALASGAL